VDGVQAVVVIRSSITCQTSLSNWFSFQMPYAVPNSTGGTATSPIAPLTAESTHERRRPRNVVQGRESAHRLNQAPGHPPLEAVVRMSCLAAGVRGQGAAMRPGRAAAKRAGKSSTGRPYAAERVVPGPVGERTCRRRGQPVSTRQGAQRQPDDLIPKGYLSGPAGNPWGSPATPTEKATMPATAGHTSEPSVVPRAHALHRRSVEPQAPMLPGSCPLNWKGSVDQPIVRSGSAGSLRGDQVECDAQPPPLRPRR
jgi:hypothetical protein